MVLIITCLVAYDMLSSEQNTNADSAPAHSLAASPSKSNDKPPKPAEPAVAASSGRLQWSTKALQTRRARWKKKQQRVKSEQKTASQKSQERDRVKQPRSSSENDEFRKEIRTAFAEVIPLLRECYEHALSDAPEIAGKLTVRYTLDGHPSVGGVVTEAIIDVSASDDIANEGAMVECVTQTTYTLELPSPPNGPMTVSYPLVFNAGETPDKASPPEKTP